MSTISVARSERLAAAPALGRPDVAAAGNLYIIAACGPDVVATCMPLFGAMGQKTIHIGDVPRAANLVKLSGNFLIASVMEALRVPMPLASLVHDLLQTLIARDGEELDWSAVGRLAATDAGLPW